MSTFKHRTSAKFIGFLTLSISLLCYGVLSVSAQTSESGVSAPSLADSAINIDATSQWFEEESLPGGGQVVGDFVVGPGKIELEIAPGESKTIMMSVSNRIGKRHHFNIETEDTTGSKDPGKTVDLLGKEVGPYTLKDYISIPNDSFELDHNKRARIPVTITIPADAEPGGRYGSVLINTVAVERQEAGENEVVPQSPIIARIGTLFFITIPGEVEREGKLLAFDTVPDSIWFEEGPITFGLQYENTGSVHLAPYGTLSIVNTFGQEVGYVELDPWFAMPNSLRFREVIWDAQHLFGRYTATVEVNRGYLNEVDTLSVSFWILPWKLVTVIFITIFAVIFVIKNFFKRFEFRRKD